MCRCFSNAPLYHPCQIKGLSEPKAASRMGSKCWYAKISPKKERVITADAAILEQVPRCWTTMVTDLLFGIHRRSPSTHCSIQINPVNSSHLPLMHPCLTLESSFFDLLLAAVTIGTLHCGMLTCLSKRIKTIDRSFEGTTYYHYSGILIIQKRLKTIRKWQSKCRRKVVDCAEGLQRSLSWFQVIVQCVCRWLRSFSDLLVCSWQ